MMILVIKFIYIAHVFSYFRVIRNIEKVYPVMCTQKWGGVDVVREFDYNILILSNAVNLAELVLRPVGKTYSPLIIDRVRSNSRIIWFQHDLEPRSSVVEEIGVMKGYTTPWI